MLLDSVGGRYDRVHNGNNNGAKSTRSNAAGKAGRSKRRPRTGKPCGCPTCR